MGKPYTTTAIDGQTTLIEEKYLGSTALMYLLEGEERALLIDTGMGTGDLRALVSAHTKKPVWVVNTHGHFDHIGCNWQFEEIYISGRDREVLALHQDKSYLSVLIKDALPAPMRVLFSRQISRLTTPKLGGHYNYIEDGHVFHLGGRDIEVIETPGHSVGSICLLDRTTRTLFSGDTVCAKGILLTLEGSTEPGIYLQSVRRLRQLADAFGPIYPGHHDRPVDVSYIDDFNTCAEQIVSGTYTPCKAPGYVGAEYGKIAIALPEG